ncbi:tripartite tricarboxylate transporter TctB family protein [Pseudomonas sp. RL_15y_Pfl2_60]|uniref:tripartite tricarboxylate transporter TctB family protein n=1 Tax=Pseudomonas sp. RL_15y_Pfl2_60 TaxID=3088709 RepID=UPI0030D82B9C
MMQDRIFAGSSLLICAGLAIVAWGYQAPFSYEPVGARAFPLLLLALLIVSTLYQALKPSANHAKSDEPSLDRHVIKKIALCVLIMTVYAGLFEVLGFIASSMLFAIAIGYLYGASKLHGLISGVLIAIGLYLLFDYGLDVPLPLGIFAQVGS